VFAGATLIPASAVKVLPPSPECTKLLSDQGVEYKASFPPLSGGNISDTPAPLLRARGDTSPNPHPKPTQESGGEDPEPENPFIPPEEIRVPEAYSKDVPVLKPDHVTQTQVPLNPTT